MSHVVGIVLIEIVIILATFIITYLGTAYNLNSKFQKKLEEAKKSIEKSMGKTFDLKYAPITALTEIKISIVEIRGSIKGIKNAIERFEKTLSEDIKLNKKD